MTDFLDLLLLLALYFGVFVVLGGLNTLLAAAAFRVNLGAAKFPLERGEYWLRSALAGFALPTYTSFAAFAAFAAFVALSMFSNNAQASLGVAYLLFGMLMLPYPVLAVYIYNWAYALDDLLEGFKIFLIHHVLLFMLVGCVEFVRAVLHA